MRKKHSHAAFSFARGAFGKPLQRSRVSCFSKSRQGPRQKSSQKIIKRVFPSDPRGVSLSNRSGRNSQERRAFLGLGRCCAGTRRSLGQIACSVAEFALTFYRRCVSPLTGPSCRFYPSCSAYSLHCFKHFGFWRAAVLTARRLLKCHPLNPGGIDLPPDAS